MVTLLSWLGRTDLDQMKQDKPASIATIALSGKTLDSIIILASTWEDEWHDYQEWLERKLAYAGRSKTSVTIQRVRLASPIDYSSITRVMQKQLSEASSNSEQVYLNLTSGTPAMAVVSVLLGKSIGKCQLLQTSPKGELIEVDIPVDFATEYTKSSTSAIQSLTSDSPKLNPAFEAITAKSGIMQLLVKKLTDLHYLIYLHSYWVKVDQAKKSWQQQFTMQALALKCHLEPLTAVHYQRIWSTQFSLVTSKGRLLERIKITQGYLNRQMAAPCSLMKWASCHSMSKLNYLERCNKRNYESR